MKSNYFVYIILIFSIIFRHNVLNLVNNFTSNLFIKNTNLEIKLLESENKRLLNEYEILMNFKNDIKIESDYTITNIVKNSYGFNNLLINGSYKLNSEVINNEGLIGIITNTSNNLSEVSYIYDSSIVVNIGAETGKITGHNENKDIIIKEISNYNNIKINDMVYSINGSYIGKVIKIKYDILDNYLTVKTANLNNLNYVAVVSR